MTPEEYFRFLDEFWALFPDTKKRERIIIKDARL